MLPPKVGDLPILNLHSILAIAILLAHNNRSQICYCGQISLWSFFDNLTPLGVAFILLEMVYDVFLRATYKRKFYFECCMQRDFQWQEMNA